MWSSYSARHAAQLIGLPESAVRSCVRAGLCGSTDVPVRLSFRDLSALRTVKALVGAGIPLARARKELTEIQRRLPPGASLAELPIEARDGHVYIRGESAPLHGQLPLPFAPVAPPPPGELHDLPARPLEPPAPAPALTADDWFERALGLEEGDPLAAADAYRRSLRLRPDCIEAWINLGRLHAENGDGEAATECFSSALKLDPADATAVYNLGVVAQDAGREQDAIFLYSRALELDPGLAEAHYNLATLFDQSGDSRAAIRHINEYRKLTRNS
ncbi:MAG TPA: tetratricopeptide repeat protein, partial [Kofleriaceae bacterium]|nr:tetratricopeptide repeat protein [Kofleriaceae bacterium]